MNRMADYLKQDGVSNPVITSSEVTIIVGL